FSSKWMPDFGATFSNRMGAPPGRVGQRTRTSNGRANCRAGWETHFIAVLAGGPTHVHGASQLPGRHLRCAQPSDRAAPADHGVLGWTAPAVVTAPLRPPPG